jgi:hypothetical protein
MHSPGSLDDGRVDRVFGLPSNDHRRRLLLELDARTDAASDGISTDALAGADPVALRHVHLPKLAAAVNHWERDAGLVRKVPTSNDSDRCWTRSASGRAGRNSTGDESPFRSPLAFDFSPHQLLSSVGRYQLSWN